MDVRDLRDRDEDARQAWLTEHATPDPNYWLYWYAVLDAEIRARPPECREWIELRLWLIRQARPLFPPWESAMQLARFTNWVWLESHAGVDRTVPTADSIVRDCLDAIPLGRDETPRKPLKQLTVAQMRVSRRARLLVRTAEPHLSRLTDESLAAELRGWLDIAPQLV
jgi:hypothetical protein